MASIGRTHALRELDGLALIGALTFNEMVRHPVTDSWPFTKDERSDENAKLLLVEVQERLSKVKNYVPDTQESPARDFFHNIAITVFLIALVIGVLYFQEVIE